MTKTRLIKEPVLLKNEFLPFPLIFEFFAPVPSICTPEYNAGAVFKESEPKKTHDVV